MRAGQPIRHLLGKLVVRTNGLVRPPRNADRHPYRQAADLPGGRGRGRRLSHHGADLPLQRHLAARYQYRDDYCYVLDGVSDPGDTLALQIKLSELILALEGARNRTCCGGAAARRRAREHCGRDPSACGRPGQSREDPSLLAALVLAARLPRAHWTAERGAGSQTSGPPASRRSAFSDRPGLPSDECVLLARGWLVAWSAVVKERMRPRR